mgnify:CR=1 FL=1
MVTVKCTQCGDHFQSQGGDCIAAANQAQSIQVHLVKKDNICWVCTLEEVARKCPEALARAIVDRRGNDVRTDNQNDR